MMKIRPLEDFILIQRVEATARSTGGLIIPDSAKENPQEGKVIAVGPGKMGEDGRRLLMDVAPGDRVLFAKYGGTEIKIDGVKHLFMRQSDIFCVVE